jgi:hypothetical protein
MPILSLCLIAINQIAYLNSILVVREKTTGATCILVALSASDLDFSMIMETQGRDGACKWQFKQVPRAGLKEIRFHDLRHSYTSLAIAAGMDPKALQRAMGHGSIRITLDVYAHLLPCSYDGAMERMEALLVADS